MLGACASLPPRRPLPPEVEAARALLEQRWQAFTDLRSLADIEIRRDGRVQHLAGVLLLHAPASLRFEALSPFGPPILLVGADATGVTIWEILKNRAYLLPASPESNRRWLGVALGTESLVGLLAGRVRPPKDPLSGEWLPPDAVGPSLAFTAPDGRQRIWLDPGSGWVQQVEWTHGKSPARVVFAGGGPDEFPTALTLATLDGGLQVTVKYQNPAVDSGFDPALLRFTVPQGVEIQDFR